MDNFSGVENAMKKIDDINQIGKIQITPNVFFKLFRTQSPVASELPHYPRVNTGKFSSVMHEFMVFNFKLSYNE